MAAFGFQAKQPERFNPVHSQPLKRPDRVPVALTNDEYDSSSREKNDGSILLENRRSGPGDRGNDDGAARAQTIPTTAEQPGQPDTAAILAGTYVVDPAHTQVVWAVNHMGISMLNGMLGASGGKLNIDPEKLDATSLDVAFTIEDISVSFAPFAEHLLTDDFFAAAQYPEARFVSTAVEANKDGTATISGDLTIKDITQQITIKAAFLGAGINPMDEKLNIGFSGTASIKRSDFGLGAYAPGISDEVQLTINAAFIAQ